MKIVFLLASLIFFNEALFSQWVGNEDPLTIKELKLSGAQQKEIRKINSDAAVQIELLKEKDSTSEEVITRVNKIKGTRIKKIRNCLNQEQQLAWREKLKENKPRRGVTNLPNERTVQ